MADLAEHRQQPAADSNDQWLVKFEREIAGLGRNNADPFMKAFYRRLLPEMEANPLIGSWVREYPEYHEVATPGMAANQIFRSFQHRVLPPLVDIPGHLLSPLLDPKYPIGYDTTRGWGRVFAGVASNEEEAEHVQQKFLYRLIQSNVFERGGVLLAAANMFGLQDLRVWSAGSSIGLVETMMAKKDNNTFRYPTISVVERSSDQPNDYTKIAAQSRNLNWLVRDPAVRVKNAHGVDLFPGRDIGEIGWALSCSFRPHEFLNRSRRNTVERLIRTDTPFLEHVQDDFSSLGHIDFLYKRHPELQTSKPNVALFSFSLYQTSETDREQALKNAETIVDQDEGIILILDFLKIDKKGNMKFSDRWSDWDVNLYAKNMANREAGWQHVFNIREGRGRQVVLGSAVGSLAVGSLLNG